MVHARVWPENHVQPSIIIMPWVVMWWDKGSDARIQFLIYLYIGTKLSSFQKRNANIFIYFPDKKLNREYKENIYPDCTHFPTGLSDQGPYYECTVILKKTFCFCVCLL